MPRVTSKIIGATLALALCLGLTAGAAWAQPGPRSGGDAPGVLPRIDHGLQQRLWADCQALRAELDRAHPDKDRVRQLSSSINQLWAKLTRQWFAERSVRTQAGGQGSHPGFAPGPGVRMNQPLGASH